MTTIGFDQTLIARVASGLYNLQLGNTTMDWALDWVNGGNGTVYDLANDVYARDFAAVATADVASILVQNLGITGADLVAEATAVATSYLDAAAPDARGAVVIELTSLFSGLTTPAYAPFVAAFNAQVAAAVAYAQIPGSVDVPLDQPESMEGKVFNLAYGTAAGADVMRLTGDQDVRIDFTVNDNQVRGLDLNGDGVIANDGVENNNPTTLDDGIKFEIVDAYKRNLLNEGDIANNFLGDIRFDGTGFEGDGVSTNGNIFLGGLGADIALGGIGNDFLVGGGVLAAVGEDQMFGGRNADFFFAELSLLDNTDGNSLFIDGGSTSDDAAAGNNTPQDSDWLLIEVSDDEDGTLIDLAWWNDGSLSSSQSEVLRIITGAGQTMHGREIEHVDASGNLYGFLDDVNVSIGGGGRMVDGENVGIGSSAQLEIRGSIANNILIGGFDNDLIMGRDGNDLLMGGNLNYLNNPNLLGIVNNGMDEMYGGDGDDHIVFEADGGIIDGGADHDTLWLTREALGTQSAADMTTDGTLRFDLLAQNINASAGYGGADAANTQDQTNYSGAGRVRVSNMESVIATGLGAVDYLAAGSNDPELVFNNQQNHFAYNGDLDLRGTAGVNTLYAAAGDDVIEGRQGGTLTFDNEGTVISDDRDKLSGGEGNDDFLFSLNGGGDNVDVIHRQTDLDVDGDGIADNLTDGTFGQDFGLDTTSTTGDSVLLIRIEKAAGNAPGDELIDVVNFVSEIRTGIRENGDFTTINLDTVAIQAATTYQELTDAINAALDDTPFGADLNATLQADGITIFISDSQGRELADNLDENGDRLVEVVGAGVTVNQRANTATDNHFQYGEPVVTVSQDRLIYVSYEDRADGERVDDDSVLGSTISLGANNYAEDLVIHFGTDGTRIAERQAYDITFTNLTTQDRVTITVNGVQYRLQVGVDLDGNIVADEDGIGGESQADIQASFLARLTDFINSFNDQNTAAGQVAAALAGSTITLTQANYNGEETVFMTTPTVALDNLSSGEPATATVMNVSAHEVHLLDFEGRNNALNRENVLFWGDTETNRSFLETAKAAGGMMTGSEAILIDGGANDLADVAVGSSIAAFNNTATNFALAANFSVHGDDFLIGGVGNDHIHAGTGDDRVIGSAGTDVVDGGKNYVRVQVLGEAQARVYFANAWEAASVANLKSVYPELQPLTISSIATIQQSETGTNLVSGVFNDTLQFQQADFGANARFTIVIDNFAVTGAADLTGVVEFRNDGAGRVLIDANGDGVNDVGQVTTFTNFENIRTISGTGMANAAGGQGRDTLDVSALSSSTATGGVSYNLTNDGGQGEVRIDENATSNPPVPGDYTVLALKVDGVENVISGTGNDLLIIDETEADKDNVFTAGLGTDRIIYRNQYEAGFAADSIAQPSVTIRVTGEATSTVTSTAGRNGTTVAVDTLSSVERISLESRTAEGSRENDVLDVTTYTNGIVVDYTNGQVRTGIVADTGVQVTIDGLARVENVWGAGGSDTVVVASAAQMSGLNGTSDTLADAKDISFAHFRDFDTLTAANARVPFVAQTSAQIANMINEGQYTFDLSRQGGGNDNDTVDYSSAVDDIAVVVRPASELKQYVIVETDTFDDELVDVNDRVDVLIDVEQVVASQGESVLDFTGYGAGVEIKFNAPNPTLQVAALDRAVSTVQISDLTTAVPLNRSFVEYRDAGLSALTTQAVATWNRIEGGDSGERVIMASVQSTEIVEMNLRGGANEVKYNELTRSITTTLSASEFVAANPLTTGLITISTMFQDGDGNPLPGSGTHVATSYSADNGIASGALRVAASQDAEDTLLVAGLDGKIFLLAQQGTTDNQITVRLGSGLAQNSVVLTGYEILQDADSDDVYDIELLSAAILGLDLIDSGVNDHDAIRVRNDAIGFNGAGANTIDLDNINAAFGFDFDVLDVTAVTASNLILNGGTNAGSLDADVTDEVVLGVLSRVTTINDFEAVVLTQASVAAGTAFTLNTNTGVLSQGSTNVTLGTNVISFGGLVREQDGFGDSYVDDVTTGVTVTVTGGGAAEVHGGDGADTITGAGGNDIIRGNGGNDILNGGIGQEVRTIQVAGIMGAGNADGTVAVEMNGNTIVTFTEGPGLTSLGDNFGSVALGNAVANYINANLAAVNATAAWGGGAALASASFNQNIGQISFTFAAGTDVANAKAIALNVNLGLDVGTLAASAQAIVSEGSDGGVNTFVFERTAALNGVDTINNFKAPEDAGDVLDFSAFLGGAAVGALAVNFTAGLNLNGPANYGVVWNKASLAAADIVTTFTPGKIAVEDNGKAVVLVTADLDGMADATIQPYLAYYIEDTNAALGAQNWVVSQVATLNSSTELNAFALDGFVNVILGSPGPDILVGTAGADIITGFASADVIDGGAGADTYVLNLGDSIIGAFDTVTVTNGDKFTGVGVGQTVATAAGVQVLLDLVTDADLATALTQILGPGLANRSFLVEVFDDQTTAGTDYSGFYLVAEWTSSAANIDGDDVVVKLIGVDDTTTISLVGGQVVVNI